MSSRSGERLIKGEKWFRNLVEKTTFSSDIFVGCFTLDYYKGIEIIFIRGRRYLVRIMVIILIKE